VVAEFLDLLLGSLQTGARLHEHILVMHHKHPGDIYLDPRSLELDLLSLRQRVVDGVPQLVMISVVVGGDCLPCSVGYCILVSGPLRISIIALYSSQPGRGILLILNSGGVVILMRFSKSLSLFSKSLSLPVGMGASFPKVLISSASLNVSSFSVLLQGV
jgi:hypothetical protein